MTEAAEPKKDFVVAVCGGLNWDMISVAYRLPKAGETFNSISFDQCPGGKGANSAIALHRLSHVKPEGETAPASAYEDFDVKVHMVGSVGNDAIGTEMKASLERHFVDVAGVRTQEGMKSAVAVTWVESENGENRILVQPAANHALKPDELKTIEGFNTPQPDLVVAQLELERETVAQLITTAKEGGIDVLLNPSPGHYIDDDIYKGLTHLIVNESEAAIMSGRKFEDVLPPFEDWGSITDDFLRLGVKNVVITLGGNGAFISQKLGEGEFVPAKKVDPEKIVDTSGAGDTFVGAYAIRWLKSKQDGLWDLKSTVAYACIASAETIQQVGCQESVPWASEVRVSAEAENAGPDLQTRPVLHDISPATV